MSDHPCPFTLGELLAMWAMTTNSTAAGTSRIRDVINRHIAEHHAHDTAQEDTE